MATEKLVIFLKAPRPGLVKTRLARTEGADIACEIYRKLVSRLVAQLSGLSGVELRYTPDDAEAEVSGWRQKDWTLAPQGGGDLGTRLHRAFVEAFSQGCRRVAILGADCPEVTAQEVRRAWRELRRFDLVVGPATDGGYWLIGLRAPQPALFEGIAWGTEEVLAQTLQRARAAGLSIQLLQILSDIDSIEDWRRFQRLAGER